ncbi:hypothetical protein [Paenibacillus peoriae]|uniref:hypothetical protein n=1 Tax=Paenibacillus peoriae TaxID=59893 RepID=UPI00096E9300|nr:hypothetical protein [Paenibacillus peoriae]OMF51001.1 hypothetical protein BK135_01750 [Paenibacillus peoriae]
MRQQSGNEQLFKKEIQNILTADFQIKYDTESDFLKIIDKQGEEIDNATLGFIGGEINKYINIREEQTFGEKRKYPLDEFTKKRTGVLDYLLLIDESTDMFRHVFEAYHDENKILSMEKFSVSKRNNLKYDEFNAYLSVDEAEKLVLFLLKFIERNKKE